MTDESMIERVARVLEPYAWNSIGGADERAYSGIRDASLSKARTILTAMREPTEAIAQACCDVPEQGWMYATFWKEMIDAALAEKTGDIESNPYLATGADLDSIGAFYGVERHERADHDYRMEILQEVRIRLAPPPEYRQIDAGQRALNDDG